MNNTSLHFQSKESREKVLGRFCDVIAISSFVSIFIFLFFNIYFLSVVNALVSLFFLLFSYLNKQGKFNLSRTGIIAVSNLSVLIFSLYLGFHSGIYLYLFAAPLLIYLLFDYKEKKAIITVFIVFLSNALFIYLLPHSPFHSDVLLDPQELRIIHSINFCCTLTMCIAMVTYFAQNNSQYIQGLKNQQEILNREITMRIASEDLVTKSLREREILLSEIHHRVKNNLAIISSMINLQMDDLKEELSRAIFQSTKDRIYTMALIHNQLYENQSFEKVNFPEYVTSFCKKLEDSLKHKDGIKIISQIEPLEINIRYSIPLALILNELVTNAFKHAFTEMGSGEIRIYFQQTEVTGNYVFSVADNGKGVDAAVLDSKSMGITIINALAEQLDATYTMKNENGCVFEMHFKMTA